MIRFFLSGKEVEALASRLEGLLERVLADPDANRREILEAWVVESAGRTEPPGDGEPGRGGDG